MKLFRWRYVLPCLILAFSVGRMSSAEDWPHWRGPERNDISSESSGWNQSAWPGNTLWEASVGEGGSSPVVVDGSACFWGWKDGKDVLTCIDLHSGATRWTRSLPAPRYGRHSLGDKGLYSGSCSTPEYDPESGLLFTLGIDGDLTAWRIGNEAEVAWQKNLYDIYQAPQRPEVAQRRKTRRDHGYVSSPLATAGQLIVEVGGNRGTLVALNPEDGQELWTSECTDEAGHTGGPVPIRIGTKTCVAVLTLRNLLVVEIEGDAPGSTVALHPWTTDFGNNIATAAVYRNSVIITSAYNQFAMCRLDVSDDAVQEVWRNSRVASGVCSPIIDGRHVYWSWRGIHCVDFETGQELWVGGKTGSQGSCILTSDSRLLTFANKGDVILAETFQRSPDSYTELARSRVLKSTDAWPHAVLSHGRLICRDRSGAVRCLDVSNAR